MSESIVRIIMPQSVENLQRSGELILIYKE